MYQLFKAARGCMLSALLLPVIASGPLAQSTASVSSAQSAAEPINVDSLTALPVIGRIETLTGARLMKLFPLEGGAYVQRVDFPGASSFRLHFSVLAPRDIPEGSWGVKILNFAGNEERWSLAPEAPVRSFWSSEIRGSRARVVVTATEAVAGRLQVIIDKVAFMQSITTPQTEINFKLRPIAHAEVPTPVRRAGRSVARLIIQHDGDDLGPVPCTGFVVGRDVLMTNRHCIRSGSEAKNTDVQFDYDVDGAEPVHVGVKELLLTSCDLDFVLLRLDRSLACRNAACNTAYERPPLPLARNATLTPRQTRLVAIQHPDGEAKQVSLAGCIADQLGMVGSSSMPTDFAHKCDTKNGSSGSPIQLISDGGVVGAVVGLHHLGVRIDAVNEEEPKLINRAVSVKEIIEYITRLKPALLNDLTLQ